MLGLGHGVHGESVSLTEIFHNRYTSQVSWTGGTCNHFQTIGYGTTSIGLGCWDDAYAKFKASSSGGGHWQGTDLCY